MGRVRKWLHTESERQNLQRERRNEGVGGNCWHRREFSVETMRRGRGMEGWRSYRMREEEANRPPDVYERKSILQPIFYR